jgi:hypothetical protein
MAINHLMMGTEDISETLVFNSILTQVIAQDDFSSFIRRENFKPYIKLSRV